MKLKIAQILQFNRSQSKGQVPVQRKGRNKDWLAREIAFVQAEDKAKCKQTFQIHSRTL